LTLLLSVQSVLSVVHAVVVVFLRGLRALRVKLLPFLALTGVRNCGSVCNSRVDRIAYTCGMQRIKVIRRHRNTHVPLPGGLWTRHRLIRWLRAFRAFSLGLCAAFLALGALQALLLWRWTAIACGIAPFLGWGVPQLAWAQATLRRAQTNPRSLRARRTWYAFWRKAAHGR
jgi:hypothetical protein